MLFNLNSLYQTILVKAIAKIKFNLPHRSKSGTNMFSIIFIVITITIWNTAQYLGCIRNRIHTAMMISEIPISRVSVCAYSIPNICPTISWCLGTRFRILQYSPLTNHTKATKKVSISLWSELYVSPIDCFMFSVFSKFIEIYIQKNSLQEFQYFSKKPILFRFDK